MAQNIRNIIATGKNYRKHILEMGHPIPEAPSFFLKPSSSLIADGGVILLPPESTRVDHEVELAIFIQARPPGRGEGSARARRGLWGRR